MPWTAQNQQQAEAEAAAYKAGYATKMADWQNAIRSGKPIHGTEHAALKEYIRQWQQNLEHLKSQSDAITSNEPVMDELGQLVTRLADDKVLFDQLSAEAGTRTNQADSVNPKIQPSPYTNMLGLQRMFRQSTQTGILIASIVFGILALAVLGYIVYIVQVTGAVVRSSPTVGGSRVGTRL